MVKPQGRYENNAYRMANLNICSTDLVAQTKFEDGCFVTISSDGTGITHATSTSDVAWLLLGSRKTGRDQVGGKPVKKLTVLHGAFANIKTNQIDTSATYNDGITQLTLTTGGKVKPAESSDKVFCFSVGKPDSDGFLTIFSNIN